MTFKIMPRTLMNLPLPALLAFDTPTIQRVSEISAVMKENKKKVKPFSVTSKIMLTAMFKSDNKKPNTAHVLDALARREFDCTVSFIL